MLIGWITPQYSISHDFAGPVSVAQPLGSHMPGLRSWHAAIRYCDPNRVRIRPISAQYNAKYGILFTVQKCHCHSLHYAPKFWSFLER